MKTILLHNDLGDMLPKRFAELYANKFGTGSIWDSWIATLLRGPTDEEYHSTWGAVLGNAVSAKGDTLLLENDLWAVSPSYSDLLYECEELRVEYYQIKKKVEELKEECDKHPTSKALFKEHFHEGN